MLKSPGLADNASQVSSKTNCRFTTPLSFQRTEKHTNEDEQRLPQSLGCGLGRFVRRYNDCKYPHSYLNVRIGRSVRKFFLVKQTYSRHLWHQPRGTSDVTNQHARNIPRDHQFSIQSFYHAWFDIIGNIHFDTQGLVFDLNLARRMNRMRRRRRIKRHNKTKKT